MQILISILIILLGASFGSFANLFIYRREKTMDFVIKPSFCESCNKKIKKLDLIPIISYILLKGKCRNCNSKIRSSIFVFEMLSGFLFLFIFYKYKLTLNFFIIGLELLVLLVISYIDFKTEYIYTMDVFILFILEFIFKIYNNLNLVNAFLGALFISGLVALIILLTKAMGVGDLELFFVASFIGSIERAFMIFTLSFFVASVVAIILIALKKKTRKQYIAFGPFISIATMIIIFLR